MNWIQALKKWNSQDNKTGSWCVPRKGSSDHAKVKSYMTGKAQAKEDDEATIVDKPKKQKAKSMMAKPQGVIKKSKGKLEASKMKDFPPTKAKGIKGQMKDLALVKEAIEAIQPSAERAKKRAENAKLLKELEDEIAGKKRPKVKESKEKSKDSSSVNVLVPRSIKKKVTTSGSNVKQAFDEIMNRFQIKGDPKTYFIPGKLKAMFLDDVASTAMVYNVEGKLEEIMEARGPRLALTYAQNDIPPGFKEAKSVLLKKK